MMGAPPPQGPPEGGGPVAPVGPPPLPPAVQAAIDMEAKFQKIQASLYAKAELLWASRDVSSAEDSKAVIVSLAHKASVEGIQDYVGPARIAAGFNLTWYITQMNVDVRSRAIDRRTQALELNWIHNQVRLSWAFRWNRVKAGLLNWFTLRYPTLDPHHRLMANEKEPSKVPFDRWVILGMALRLFGDALMEELFKRTLARWIPVGREVSQLLRMAGVASLFALAENQLKNAGSKNLFLGFFLHNLFVRCGLIMGTLLHTAWNLGVVLRAGTLSKTLNMLSGFHVEQEVCCREVGLPQVATQQAFKVRWGEHTCKPGFGCRQMFGVAGFKGTVFRSCSCNERVSVCGRVGKQLDQHSKQAQVLGVWRRVKRNFEVVVNQIRPVMRPCPYKDWVKSFPPARREQLERDYLDLTPCVDKTVKGFIKREVAVKTVEPKFKDPRWIQGCPLWMSRVCGPWLRVLAKNVRKGLSPRLEDDRYRTGSIQAGQQFIYTCGMSAEAVGDAFMRSLKTMQAFVEGRDRVVIVEDDQSRFDMHITKGPFGLLDMVYGKKLLSRKVKQALRRDVCKGTARGGTRYSVPYTMQSGMPDTSVGDTIVNAAMKYYIHGVGRPWICIACGDDSVTVTLESEVTRLGGVQGLTTSYSAMGMDVEVLLRSEPLDVGFCSSRFYPHKGSYVLMPKPGRLLSKIGWDMKDRSVSNQYAWARGVGKTLEWYGQIDPLMGALGKCFLRSCGLGKIIQERQEYKIQLAHEHDTDWRGVSLYYAHHYGMSPGQVRDLATLLCASKLGDTLDNAMMVHVVEVDQ
jgi:hypothetical protein